jgi:hypothetical protein
MAKHLPQEILRVGLRLWLWRFTHGATDGTPDKTYNNYQRQA